MTSKIKSSCARKLSALSLGFGALLVLLFVMNFLVSTWLSADISTPELNILDDVKPELTHKSADAALLVQKNAEVLTTESDRFESEIPHGSAEAFVLANPATTAGTSNREELRYFNHGAAAIDGEYSSNKIIYKNIWSNTDLLVTMLGNGAKEDLILKNTQAPLKFQYIVETVGLKLRLTADGGYEFIADSGKRKFYTPAPDLTDAAGKKITADVKYGLGWDAQVIAPTVVEPVVQIPATEELIEPIVMPTIQTPEVVEPAETETKVARPQEQISTEEIILTEESPVETIAPTVETPAEDQIPSETTPTEEPAKAAFLPKLLTKLLSSDILESERDNFENSTKNFEQVSQNDGSILRRYKLQLTVESVSGLTYPLDLDPSTFVQTEDEAADQAAEEADDSTAAVTTIGRNLVTNDLTVRGTLTTSGTNLSIDSGLLYLDSDNDMVGIGTTEPSEQLDISGNFQIPSTTHTDLFGIIYKNGNPFIHDFNYGDNGTVTTDGQNIFIGENAGNFTMGATANGPEESSYNLGIGSGALSSNSIGSYNIAIGSDAFSSSADGWENTAVGSYALEAAGSDYDVNDNSAFGYHVLGNLIGGDDNSAFGTDAGTYTSSDNENTEAHGSVYIGAYTRASADGLENENVFGYDAVGIGSNTVVLGNDDITTTALKGNVGIGTTDPSEQLEVAGTIYSTTGGFKLPDGTILDAAADLGGGNSVWTSGADSVIFYDSGYVGIGTTEPSEQLEVAGTIYSTVGGFKLPDGTILDAAADLGGGGSLWTENEDSSVYYSLGNVGIGTTTPAAKLDVAGVVRMEKIQLVYNGGGSCNTETVGGVYYNPYDNALQVCLYNGVNPAWFNLSATLAPS